MKRSDGEWGIQEMEPEDEVEDPLRATNGHQK
jgi:hypothetical protein